MSIHESRVAYPDSNGKIYESYVAAPLDALTSGKKYPVVLLLHAFHGLRAHEEEVTRKFVSLGYVGFAVDYFGKGIRGETREQAYGLIKPLLADRRGDLKPRLLLGLEQAKLLPYVDTTRIAVFGYCFGGTAALDLARYNVGITAAVSFHGGFYPLPEPLPENETKPITTKIMICHGDADSHIPIEKGVEIMAELRNRDADFQFISYAHAKHGFTDKTLIGTDTEGVGYSKSADERSWSQSTTFLAEVFNN